MAEKTKTKSETLESSPAHSEKEPRPDDQGAGEYYYDDAYGYETYRDEDDQSDDRSD